MGSASSLAGFVFPPRLTVRTGFYSYDVRDRKMQGDERLAKYFGVPPKDLAKGISVKPIVSAIHPDDRDRVLRSLNLAVQDGGLFLERYRTQIGNGEGYHVRTVGFCFRDESGQPTCFVGATEPEEDQVADNVDRTIEYSLAAYRLAGHTRKPMAQFLIALALEDMGFVAPESDPITDGRG